jgi:arginine exporter protein ArgO
MQQQNSELVRRHRSTLRVVLILLGSTVLLSVLAFIGRRFLVPRIDPVVDAVWKITIVILGLGSIAFRRTMFASMRLRDIGGVAGAKGLLDTLAGTTLKVAIIGEATAVSGFVATLLTGNDRYTYGAGVIAVVVLLYCLPTRSSWERTLYQFAPYSAPLSPPEPPKEWETR